MNRNITLSTYENNVLLFKNITTALFEDNFLTYHTDNDTIKINLQTFSFTKENNDTFLKITKNKCYLNVKELNKTLEIPIEYLDFIYNNDEIIIEYKLISQENNLKIVIEIGSEINEL